MNGSTESAAADRGVVPPPRKERPAPHSLDAERFRFRMASVNVGVALTAVAALGTEAYAAASPDRPHRAALMLLAAFGLASAPAILFCPRERIIRSRWREPFFVVWSCALIGVIGAATALDGGTDSPLRSLFVLPLIFAALSYPPGAVAIVATVDITAYTAVALISAPSPADTAFVAFSLGCAAMLCIWQAINHHRQDARLGDAAEALQASETVSWAQALQQEEIAAFGQRALEGARISDLFEDAVESVQRILGTEIVGILERQPNDDSFLIRAARGFPDGVAGKATVPGGRKSQAGFTLLTGQPVIVEDWSKEQRFSRSDVLARAAVGSGITVAIKGRGEPYGIIGAQALAPRMFGDRDVTFLQAIANSLAYELERRIEESDARRRAMHDALTGLPNRALFLDRLQQALAETERSGQLVAVLFMDLDHFKVINDSLGHQAGDALLREVAPRLRHSIRPGDTVARFGGDEFGILLRGLEDERDATRVAERVASELLTPFAVAGREHFVSVSIGIALGSGGQRPDDLIRDADTAMYSAKDRGRGRYEIFDQVMRARLRERMTVENELRTAIDSEDFGVVYQPVVSLTDGRITGAEALVRWRHPERGVLRPDQFISVAEETGLIRPLGQWVLETACREAATWQDEDPDARPIEISVNISARQLSPEFIEVVQRALSVSGIQPPCLALELTEDAVVEDDATVREALSNLQEVGVHLTLDDFGAGYSSLAYLRHLPFQTIKLDRSFVRHLRPEGVDQDIVGAVLSLGKALNLQVVAEGIETEEQLQVVRRLGCELGQGFYFSHPLSAEKFATFLASGPVRAAELS
jgi:diguanylate cyclase (GGDEF)-like protein